MCVATLDAILATEISPELVPAKEGETPQSTEAHDRSLRAAGLQPVLHAAPRLRAVEDRLPGAARVGATRRSGDWPPGFPARSAQRLRPGDDPQVAGGVPAPLLRVQPVQARRRCRTGRRSAPAARCRRAATGARRRTATPTPGSRNWSATFPEMWYHPFHSELRRQATDPSPARLERFHPAWKNPSWPGLTGLTGPSPSAEDAWRETVPHWPGMARSSRAMTGRGDFAV